MPKCGSQCTLCDLPIRFDTYKGCSHSCAYCFAKRNSDITKIETGESAKSLAHFVAGRRTRETAWCDWDIPIHWGGMSDPFQPAERLHRRSLQCLKVLKKTQHPFVVSTKGRLVAEEPYIGLLAECNAVVQVSLVCPSYDKFERGCPTYAERLEIVRKLAKRCKRVIVRIQPYMTKHFTEVNQSIKDCAAAGVHGVIVEGMKFIKRQPGLVRIGADWCYPYDTMRRHFEALRKTAHESGIKIYAGENRLRRLGDSMTCCGIDGLDGFTPNTFNLNHIMHGEAVEPTEAMRAKGSASCFESLYQNTVSTRRLAGTTFDEEMRRQGGKAHYREVFGFEAV